MYLFVIGQDQQDSPDYNSLNPEELTNIPTILFILSILVFIKSNPFQYLFVVRRFNNKISYAGVGPAGDFDRKGIKCMDSAGVDCQLGRIAG